MSWLILKAFIFRVLQSVRSDVRFEVVKQIPFKAKDEKHFSVLFSLKLFNRKKMKNSIQSPEDFLAVAGPIKSIKNRNPQHHKFNATKKRERRRKLVLIPIAIHILYHLHISFVLLPSFHFAFPLREERRGERFLKLLSCMRKINKVLHTMCLLTLAPALCYAAEIVMI